jgi:integral membrane sensor domain MASE1
VRLLAKAANAKSSKSKRQKVNTSLDCFAILFHNKIISSSLSLPLSFCVLSLLLARAAKYPLVHVSVCLLNNAIQTRAR